MKEKRNNEITPIEHRHKRAISSVQQVGLCYVSDCSPGITRQRVRNGFRYRDVEGQVISDPAELSRIKELAIPPAWTDVWICPLASGHLQATGRDTKGRKQYRYHAHWRQVRDETKYGRMTIFARALPKIRMQVDRDLARSGLSRKKVLATVVRLLETTFIRIGNDEYVRSNGSYGLTTLRDHHVAIKGTKLAFQFRGKSGKDHRIALTDARMARIVKRCKALPGYELFQYIDGDGEIQDVKSTDVNQYLRKLTGEEFTAKDFRTWAGTVLATQELAKLEQPSSPKQAQQLICRAVENVAQKLGNTPNICRRCYIHPAILIAYKTGKLHDIWVKSMSARPQREKFGLRPAELVVMKIVSNYGGQTVFHEQAA